MIPSDQINRELALLMERAEALEKAAITLGDKLLLPGDMAEIEATSKAEPVAIFMVQTAESLCITRGRLNRIQAIVDEIAAVANFLTALK